jgi:hypothetical protein
MLTGAVRKGFFVRVLLSVEFPLPSNGLTRRRGPIDGLFWYGLGTVTTEKRRIGFWKH